ncbi:hypothetical protein E4U42_005571 [Claviceps africana]|uniref:[histone H3]-trimethyl-L-lysine(9) demethylase n=1 Tax=Claviceps africana TaxID=83212 RepID=A0A8K0J3K7_9HYPO|nr:hypothetical protein E4U42_005571 [Claviceps africana]
MSTDVVSVPESVDPGAVPRSGFSSDSSPNPKPVGSAPMSAASHDAVHVEDQIECAKPAAPVFLHSPPDSNNATKSDGSDSELSELEDDPTLDDALAAEMQASTSASAPGPQTGQQQQQEDDDEEDMGEMLPAEWSGAVPIFRPTWNQFKNFKRFMTKVDCYGMKSGIIKIIPPPEWKATQPPLDELVKTIRVREPIKQDIMGSNGTYRQVNILHGRSYNVPQWRQLCEQSEHQPPARRGERRANADKARQTRSRHSALKSADPSTTKKRGRGRPVKNKTRKPVDGSEQRPMTPVSPKPEAEDEDAKDKPVNSIEQREDPEDGGCKDDDDESAADRVGGRMSASRAAKPTTQSVSARRKYSRREGSAMIDEAAFKDFDYQMDISEFTPQRCEELERAYWKTLTYAAPLYGADMMGTLFDDRTETWNLNKLPNLLDVLGTKIPGVNTAYLYLGMWKATFAWHLEDVDLYSINYLHFGAPKQWYSISQADARRFEEAMKSVWPADAKACSQFLRHKGFLISPHHLLQHYGIKVNKVVSYPGEFVVTYPYGYHSGYNLGYNCAEAVNFALDTWLEMGKIAKRCECAQAQDSVWINVHEIERKLRGEETEYEETEDDEDEEDDEEVSGLPTPPASHGVKFKEATRKRKRGSGDKGPKPKVKKIKLRLKTKVEPPCCLCPNDVARFEVLSTDDGRKAHRICALYLPETYIDSVDGKEVICNVASVHKDRLSLRCLFCRSRRGACFQCSHKKCARGYHATCAAAAGVFVEDQDVPVFDENGVEYKEQAFEFSCRFHRARRDKKIDVQTLEGDSRIRAAAQQLRTGDICQMQFLQGEIFAGVVVENRQHEETVLIDILPHGDRLEAEWKWLVLPDPSDYHLPRASAKALPMPASRKAKDDLKAKRLQDETPKKDDIFAEGYKWAEFVFHEVSNKEQIRVDFAKPEQIWYYLGKTSTEARAQYTEDAAQQRHNPKGNFLDTFPKPAKPLAVSRPSYHHQSYIAKAMAYSYNLAANYAAANQPGGRVSLEKPYVYKPKQTAPVISAAFTNQHGQSLPYINPLAASAVARSSAIRPDYDRQASTPSRQPSMAAVGQPTFHQGNHNAYHGQAHASQRPQQPVVAAPIQQCKPSWQIYSSVYQKYPYFQVNHNRDLSKYRTPYAPGQGFTNGYEGDLRAHLMGTCRPHAAERPHVDAVSAGPAPRQQLHLQQQQQQQQQQQPSPLPRVQQSHQQQQSGHRAAPAIQAPKSKPPPATKSFKVGLPAAFHLSLQSTKSALQVPAKISPVPLPPHVVAAMAKTSQNPPRSAVGPNVTAATAKLAASGPPQPQPQVVAEKANLVAASGPPLPRPQVVTEKTNSATASGPPQSQSQVVAEKANLVPAQWRMESEASPHMSPARREPQAILTPPISQPTQEFADVPGSESMQFMDRMMQNLRRASMNGDDGSNS